MVKHLFTVQWIKGSTLLGGRKEGKVLFNDILNTFCFSYKTLDIIKGSFIEQERKPVAAIICAILFDWQQGFFYMHHSTYRITHTMTFVKPDVEHWME